MAARKVKKKKVVKPNLPYELTASSYRGFSILAVDPGSRNFGISCVGLKGNKPVVLANAVLMNPVNTLVDFTEARAKFLAEIDTWIQMFRPRAIIGERFQTRGNGGPLIEQVSTMLGLTAGRYFPLPVRLITASTWKNKFNRRFQTELAKMYPEEEKWDLKLVYPGLKMTPHAFDATLIGVYGLEYGFKRNLNYSPKSIIAQAEKASLMEFKEKRKRVLS